MTVALSFIILSAASAIYVSASELNYLHLFPALNQIQEQQTFGMDKLSFTVAPNPNESSLVAQITVSNPTDYSGLRIDHVSATISFSAPINATTNATLFNAPDSLQAYQKVGSQLGANSMDSITVPIQLSPEQTSQLVSFNKNHRGQIMANVNLRIDIATFLESVTGTIVYQRTQYVPLVSN